MMEVEPVKTQDSNSSDAAQTASSDALGAAGFSVTDLFSTGANYESAMNLLQANGIDSEEATAMVAFAQGLASKNEAAIAAFSTGLSRYQVAQHKESALSNEVSAMYESDETIRSDANTLADLLSKLYGENFTGDNVLGGMTVTTSFFFPNELSSKKKAKYITILLAVVISACGSQTSEIQATPSPVITELAESGLTNAWSTTPYKHNGTEYYAQDEKTIFTSGLRGYVDDGTGTIIPTVGTFSLASVELETISGQKSAEKATILMEVRPDGEPGVELLLVNKVVHGKNVSFDLVEANGKVTDKARLFVIDGKIILQLTADFNGDGKFETYDYVLSPDAVNVAQQPTSIPTESPSLAVEILTALIELDAFDVEAAPADKTPTPNPTNTPDSSPTPLPTKDSMKMMTKSDFENFSYETSFGQTMTAVEFKNLDNILPFQDITYDNSTTPMQIDKFPNGQGTGVELRADFGKNLFMIRPFAVELTDGNVYHGFVCLGVVKGSDGNNKLIRMNLSFDTEDPTIKLWWEGIIQTFMHQDAVLMNVDLLNKVFVDAGGAYYEPLVGPDQIKEDLYAGVVDDQIGDVLLWVKNATLYTHTK